MINDTEHEKRKRLVGTESFKVIYFLRKPEAALFWLGGAGQQHCLPHWLHTFMLLQNGDQNTLPQQPQEDPKDSITLFPRRLNPLLSYKSYPRLPSASSCGDKYIVVKHKVYWFNQIFWEMKSYHLEHCFITFFRSWIIFRLWSEPWMWTSLVVWWSKNPTTNADDMVHSLVWEDFTCCQRN